MSNNIPIDLPPSSHESTLSSSCPASSSTIATDTPMPAPFGRNPDGPTPIDDRHNNLLTDATTMDAANVPASVISAFAQTLMGASAATQPFQLTTQQSLPSPYRHNLMMAPAALINSIQQQALANLPASASTLPLYHQYLSSAAPTEPSTASATSATNYYYQPILSAPAAAPSFCSCACFPTTCPVHNFDLTSANSTSISGTANALPLTTSLFGNPYRAVVLPQSQVLSGQTPAVAPVVNRATSTFPTHLMMQQHLRAVAQAATSSAASNATSEDTANALRLKRQNTYHNSDGRPAKVRRVLSDTNTNMPSSSQPIVDRAPEPLQYQEHIAEPLPLSSRCMACRNLFSNHVQRSPMCLCHRALNCEFSQICCTHCFMVARNATRNVESLYTPTRITSSYETALNNVQNAAGFSFARRQAERNLQATQYFYQQSNPNFVQLAATQTPVAPPAAATAPSPLMVVNNRPFMEFFFFTNPEHSISLNNAQTQQIQQIQQLHQLQQVLTNGPVHEPPPVGATHDQIKKTTTICSYTKDPNVPEQERDRCTVCLCDFETGDEVRALNCSHLFHVDCIDRWLVYNKKCPVCRIEMDKPLDYTPLLAYDEELYGAAPAEADPIPTPAAAAS